MSFLEKFKGKTSLLKRDEVASILGGKSSTVTNKIHNNQLNSTKLEQISNSHTNQSHSLESNLNKKSALINSKIINRSNVKNKIQNPEIASPAKKIIQNPFLVQNQFFLDEQQQQQVMKRRKHEQIRIRMQKERKKRQQLHQKMKKSLKESSLISQKPKQWVKLGGLGANIGGEQWSKKKNLHDKMMKFAEQIKKINTVKLEGSQSVNLPTNESMNQRANNREIDARTLGIKYSKTIQKPTFYTLQRTRYEPNQTKQSVSDVYTQKVSKMRNPLYRSEIAMNPMENQFNCLNIDRNFSQLQNLENKHKEFKNLVYGTKI